MKQLSKGETAAVRCIVKDIQRGYNEIEKLKTRIDRLMDEQTVIENKVKQQEQLVLQITGADNPEDVMEKTTITTNDPDGYVLAKVEVKYKEEKESNLVNVFNID